MLFSKTSLSSKMRSDVYGIFLFDTEDNCNATQQTFLVKRLVTYGLYIWVPNIST